MLQRQWVGLVVGGVAMVSAAGCSAAAEPTNDAPRVDVNAVEERLAWNGPWYINTSIFNGGASVSFTDTQHGTVHADASRNGGICLAMRTGANCSSASQCGAGPHGYCFQNECYVKPSDDSTCSKGPNLHGATRYAWASMSAGQQWAAIGCLASPFSPSGCMNLDNYVYDVVFLGINGQN
jgi:hypothetical protein